MSLSTDHRGHTIMWSDNSDNWYCSDFSFSHASLSKVRDNIDKMYRDLRKASSVRCLYVRCGDDPNVGEATLVEYIGPKTERGTSSLAPPKVVGHRVAAMRLGYGGSRVARQSDSLSDFAPDTPEVVEAMDKAREKCRAARALMKEADAIVQAIPRLKLADIEGLVRAADTKLQEGDQK